MFPPALLAVQHSAHPHPLPPDFNLSKLLEDTGVRSTSLGGMLNPRWLVSSWAEGCHALHACMCVPCALIGWEQSAAVLRCTAAVYAQLASLLTFRLNAPLL